MKFEKRPEDGQEIARWAGDKNCVSKWKKELTLMRITGAQKKKREEGPKNNEFSSAL